MNAMNPSVDEERIRVRAFELWQERGCPIGSPQDDWFAAKVALEAPADERPSNEGSSDDDPAGPRRLPLGLRFVTEQRSSSNDASSTPPPPSTKRRTQKGRKGSRAADEAARAPAKAAGARKSR
jgi:hypothetical protein